MDSSNPDSPDPDSYRDYRDRDCFGVVHFDDKKEVKALDLGKKSPDENVLLLKQLFHQHDYQINSLKEEIKFLREQLELKD